MKNLIAAILMLMLASTESFAQWTTSGSNIYNSNTGNVGIGTAIPLEKLHVQNGSVLISSNSFASYLMGTLKFSSNSYNYAWAGLSGNSNGQGWDQIDLLFYTAFGAPSEKMRLMANTGYLGIGTSTPAAKLHSVSTGEQLRLGYDATHYTSFTSSSTGALTIASTSNTLNLSSTETYLTWQSGAGQNSNSARLNFVGYGQTAGFGIQALNTGSYGTKDLVFYAHDGSVHSDYTSYDEAVRFTYRGWVGIGTATPAAKLDVNGPAYIRQLYVGVPDGATLGNMAGNKLAVNGTAVFVKAKVAIYGPITWPDYVFEPSYKLTTLDSLEQFIQLNKHLPEMPSAADVEKDGLDLGDNQALLLKKIEELTLIVIEQNKRIEKQSQRIKNIEDGNIVLKTK